MQTIEIQNSNELMLIDDADYEDVNQWRWFLSHGRIPRAYIRDIGRKRIAEYLTGKKDIDHKDRNPLNNQRSNLRHVGRKGQQQNRNHFKNNTSGYKGVSQRHPTAKFVARIRVDGVLKELGRWPKIEDAAKAYDKAAIKYFGNNASLNFPKD